MIEISFELMKMAGVGVVSGLFASFLANDGYRKRKFWEIRVAAYQNAIEALSDIVYYYERHYKAEVEHRGFSEEDVNNLNLYIGNALPKLRKIADSGTFLFSETADRALRKFFEKESSDSGYLETVLTDAKFCLDEIIKCSKSDLKLVNRFNSLLNYYRRE